MSKVSRRPSLLLTAVALGALIGSTSLQPLAYADAPATGGMAELAQRFASKDFRVRVQAALLLGKTADGAALPVLLNGLRDESAAVRAASAAALATLSDPAALDALRARRGDDNAAVRRQIESTIGALEKQQKAEGIERAKATLLVKLDGVKNRSSSGAPEALGAAAQATRAAFRKIPGVALLHPSEDPAAAAKTLHRPVIVVIGSLRDLSSENGSDGFVVSAKVEFVMQSMPEYNIVGKLSGRASVSGDSSSSQDVSARVRVQEAAVGAAVDSALSKSHEAILRAARG
ncbi:MAG TPA: HEAT repeat domain-containing protein [Polyangiaceae bacterium]|nr:HEAT repeat domain-containing protein [Polyangiaceae bacterium]